MLSLIDDLVAGHTEGASGALGLLHALFTLTLHSPCPNQRFRVKNTHIDIRATVMLSSQVQFLHAPNNAFTLMKTAGVSAFGMTGTNAHALMTASSARMQSMDAIIGPRWPIT